jgi:disulfide bond formation protein DsbB
MNVMSSPHVVSSMPELLQAVQANIIETLVCRPLNITPSQLVEVSNCFLGNTSLKKIGFQTGDFGDAHLCAYIRAVMLPVVTTALCAADSTLETIFLFYPPTMVLNRTVLHITITNSGRQFRDLRVGFGPHGVQAIPAMTSMVLGVLAKNIVFLDVFIKKGDFSGANGLQLADILWNKTDSSAITLVSCRFDPMGLAAIARAVVLTETVTMLQISPDHVEDAVACEQQKLLKDAVACEQQKLDDWRAKMLAFAAGRCQRVGERPTLVSSLSEELVHEIFRVFYKR